MLKDSDINGIISRVELIRKLEDKKEQIQMLVEVILLCFVAKKVDCIQKGQVG